MPIIPIEFLYMLTGVNSAIGLAIFYCCISAALKSQYPVFSLSACDEDRAKKAIGYVLLLGAIGGLLNFLSPFMFSTLVHPAEIFINIAFISFLKVNRRNKYNPSKLAKA